MAHSWSRRHKTLCAQAVLASVLLSVLLIARSTPPSFPQGRSGNASYRAITHHDERPRFDHNHAQWSTPEKTFLFVPPAFESAHAAPDLQLVLRLKTKGFHDNRPPPFDYLS
jgi:hypothetical protein